MAAKVLCEAGADVVMLEAGGMWDSAKDSKMSAWPYDSPRRGAATPTKPFGEFDGCIGGWDIEGEPYTQAPGSQFDWFRGRMLGGRTNHWGRISLRWGPDDFKRRSLDGIGDDWPIDLRRHQAVLRQARSPRRHLRIDGRHPERAGRHLPAAAEAALLRAADQAGGRQAEDHLHPESPVDPDAAAQRPPGVPLLRPVRPRLRDARELLVDLGAAAAGAGDRQAAHHHQRDGARGADRRQRAGDRRLVREPHRSPRLRRARARRRARGERVRVGAAAAQLDVGPLPRRPRQLERRRRPLPDRFDRTLGRRPHPEDGARRAAQRGRHRRRASLHAVVARQQERSISRAATTSSSAAGSIRRRASGSWAASSASTASAATASR